MEEKLEKRRKIWIFIFILTLVIAISVIIFINLNKEYTVYFDTTGGTLVDSVKVKKNDAITLPDNPTKEGYIFSNWLYENVALDKNMAITKDITLVANWIKEESGGITIRFDTDGGSELKDIKLSKGEKLKLPNNPVKEGYIFIGWVDEKNNPISEGIIFEGVSEILLTARWEKK